MRFCEVHIFIPQTRQRFTATFDPTIKITIEKVIRKIVLQQPCNQMMAAARPANADNMLHKLKHDLLMIVLKHKITVCLIVGIYSDEYG